MKPVDLYVRVSRVGGREHLISPDEQERRGRELAKQRGLTVGKVLIDLDESGGKWNRPGLQEALTRVRSGESGGLIVAWLDRLSRDSEHAHRLVRELNESGGAVYAPDAPADWTTPEGELQAGIVFAFAQYVRRRAASGFERAKERAVEEGICVTSTVAVGYRKRADRRLELDPVAAPVVCAAFEMRAAGRALSEIAEHLTASGVQTSYGSAAWTTQAVTQVLASRTYLGEVFYGKDRRYVNPVAHEPLVDLATWTAAQNPRPAARRSRAKGAYLLTGLVRCQACGYAMAAQDNGRGEMRYRCKTRHPGGVCPSPGYATMEALDEIVTRLFLGAYSERVAGESSDLLPELAAALDSAERRLEQALDPEVQDAAGGAWAEMVRARRADRDEAAKVLGEAKAKQGVQVDLGGRDLRDAWPSLPVEEKRQLLASMFDAIVVHRVARGDVWVVALAAGALPVVFDRRLLKGEPPALRPIDYPPDGARMVSLQDPGEGLRDVA